MRAFPWTEAMQLGFGVLKLSSKEFWGADAAGAGGGVRSDERAGAGRGARARGAGPADVGVSR